MTKRIRVGFLHVGPPAHAVVRYGRILAAAVREFADVRERSVELSGSLQRDRALLSATAVELAGEDVVHVQYEKSSKPTWGFRWRQLVNLATWFRHCRPVGVVTVHDVYPPRVPWRGIHYRFALRMLELWNRRLLVSFEEEARRLARMLAKPAKIRVIGHFVEDRPATWNRAAARAALGLNHQKVVTILGWIHNGQRKGHLLAVEALPHLSADAVMVFAGGDGRGSPGVSAALIRLATDLGVADRLRITGYVSDEEMDLHIAATDLALCPFSEMSASGSMARWLSVGRPILAFDLPQVAEYRALDPEAIDTFTPYTAAALAAAIEKQLAGLHRRHTPVASPIKQRFGLRRIAAEHVDAYRQALAESRP